MLGFYQPLSLVRFHEIVEGSVGVIRDFTVGLLRVEVNLFIRNLHEAVTVGVLSCVSNSVNATLLVGETDFEVLRYGFRLNGHVKHCLDAGKVRNLLTDILRRRLLPVLLGAEVTWFCLLLEYLVLRVLNVRNTYRKVFCLDALLLTFHVLLEFLEDADGPAFSLAVKRSFLLAVAA